MPRRRQRHLHVMLSDGEAPALGRLCKASGSTPSEAVWQMVVASDAREERLRGGAPRRTPRFVQALRAAAPDGPEADEEPQTQSRP